MSKLFHLPETFLFVATRQGRNFLLYVMSMMMIHVPLVYIVAIIEDLTILITLWKNTHI